ncbi:glycosidase [candidate division KSB1 bacterium]|nr:glycosidase [candidate division KSB1 bacterium]
MFVKLKFSIFFILPLLFCSRQKDSQWTMELFVKQDAVNPVLAPNPKTRFYCPVRGKDVLWEKKDVFNPATVVRGGKLYLLYRAEDTVGKHLGTSRIGLAVSEDGLYFKRLIKPVLYPANDFMKKYEWEGGCEDPRIVEDEEGTYYMTYTAWDGETARLCVATSSNLLAWKKHGPAFEDALNGKYLNEWSKAGSIVSTVKDSRLVAAKINGKYWMYWGELKIYIATSDNLIDWTPLEDETGEPAYVFSVRQYKHDSELVEPGPPAILRQDGIFFIYNSKNSATVGDSTLPAGTYAAGQALIDPQDPTRLLKRTENYFFKPERDYELTGQINNVCFLEGLAFFQEKWFLYYGTADSKIAVAVYDPM